MKKLTLQFVSLADLAAFSKLLNEGYTSNISKLTVTAPLQELQLNMALEMYSASVVELGEKDLAPVVD